MKQWPDSPSVRRRILCVIRWPVGGIRTYLRYVYPVLERAGYNFTFVGPNDETFERFRNEWYTDGEAEFIPAIMRRGRCHLWSVVRSELRSGRYSLIHSQGVVATCESVLANVWTRVPHLMTSHDVFRSTHSQTWLSSLKIRCVAEILRRTDAIVAVSHDVACNHLETLTNLRRGPTQVVTICNGIPVNMFQPTRDATVCDLRHRYSLSPDTRIIGFLGRFMPQKGIDILLQAVVRIREMASVVPFRIIVIASDDCEVRYRRQAHELGLTKEVIFHPFEPDPRAVMRSLDLLVIPSLWEACPILPMEALVMGIPIVGTDCIGLREVLAGTPAVSVLTGDPVSLANGLLQAIANPKYDDARAYAPHAALRFDVRNSANSLLRLCDSVIQRRSDM